MKFNIKSTPDQVELIRAMGAKDRIKAAQAQEVFAQLLSPTLGYVLDEADTTKLIFKDLTYDENTDPSLPLELFQGTQEGHFSVWSQAMPGGLPTNNIYEPINEVKFSTYRLDSAISYLRKYATQVRLDVIGKSMERLMQEILVKLNRNAWGVFLTALAHANNQGKASVILSQEASANPGLFSLDDINKLFTLMKRQNESWAQGTPNVNYGSITDLIVSPELMEFVRSMTYNPINTRGVITTTLGTATPAISMPEAERAKIFTGAGIQTLLGVNLIEMVELGVGQKYTTLFAQAAGSTQYSQYNGTNPQTFNVATNDLAIGINMNGDDSAFRALETNLDTGSTFTLTPDDQFSVRSERIGFYGSMRLGHLITNTRPYVGLVI